MEQVVVLRYQLEVVEEDATTVLLLLSPVVPRVFGQPLLKCIL